MKITGTSISEKAIHLSIGSEEQHDETREEGFVITDRIDITMRVDGVNRTRPLALIQRDALEHARSAIDTEIQRIRSLGDQT